MAAFVASTAYLSSIAAGALFLLSLLSPSVAYGLSNDYFVGKTYPEVVEIEIGGNINITCTMNPNLFKKYNASHMYFINDYTKERVPDSDIVVLNSTTIVYMLRNAQEQKTKFLCKCDNQAITDASVYVGTPPRPVINFGCRGYDFEYMICNFTQPENQLLTHYNLSFHLGWPDYINFPVCNFEGQPLVVCNVTGERSSIYSDYHFILQMENALGKKTELFNVNKLNVMVPARPGENLNVTHMTDSSIELQWFMPKWDEVKLKELQWQVLLQPHRFPVQDLSTQVRVKRNRTLSSMQLKLSSLSYAFYVYELRLSAKVTTAANTTDMWSAPLIYQFKTAARLPDRAPRTDYGSFYVNSSETDVRLYWEQLEPQEYNGDNFMYTIRATETRADGKIRQMLPKVIDSNSAVFPWRRDLYYTFEIRSRNHLGESLESSRINIFPLSYRKHHMPHSIHNVYHATNRTYTLTWVAPAEKSNLVDYTVYWCYSKRALQTECNGSIHFKHVNPNIHRFITDPLAEQEHPLNLAVSANYINNNTGMHWTSCTMDVNSDLERMEPEAQVISATAIKVQWSSESICPSILKGYNLTFCEVSNNNSDTIETTTTSCNTLPIKIEKNAKKYEIKGLKPYTMYRIEMFMYSLEKVGKVSEPLLRRTHEAAPKPPRQLNVLDVRNTSALLSWMPPSEANGRIRQYIVRANQRDFPVNASALNSTENITFVLENLTPYTFYKVYVIAETVKSSDPSNDRHFTTRIGYPSKVTNVMWHNENVLKWSRPINASGRTDFYEVVMTELDQESVVRRRISVVNGTSCILRAPTCPDPDYKTVVEVRAVNVANLETEVGDNQPLNFDPDAVDYEGNDDLVCADNGGTPLNSEQLTLFRNNAKYRLYKSMWERGSTFGCAPRQMGRITLIAFLVVLLVLVLGSLTLLCGRKYSTMSNIKCTLPAGLDAYITKDSAGGGGCGIGGSGGGSGGGGYSNDFMATAAAIERSEQRIIAGPRSFKELNNEEHRLLGTLGNDSGYMGDAHTLGRSISGGEAANVATATHNGTVDEYRRNHLHSESSADSLVESIDTAECEMDEQHMTIQPDALQLKRIIEEESAYVQPSAPAMSGRANIAGTTCDNGYIKPNNLAAWPQQKSSVGYIPMPCAQKIASPAIAATPTAVNSGYVAIDSIPNTTKLNAPAMQSMSGIPAMPTSGYVQPSTFQKLMFAPVHTNDTPTTASNLSGYTSLDALGKPGMGMGMNTYTTDTITQNATGRQPLPGISGYVTQGELNAFGQQQQQQQYLH